jgi:Mg-chelatase subunit ChlD
MKLSILPLVLCLSLGVSGQQAPAASPGTPLQYVLLNDKSGRTLWPGGIEEQANAAAQLLKEVVKHRSDVGSLINFNQEFLMEVENSTDPTEIAAKLARQGRGGTQLFDALILAANWLAKQDSPDKRKVIFVFSDGDDNASQINLQETIVALQRTQIPVFVVAPSVVERKPQGKALKQLAARTGGHVSFLHENESFDFALVSHDLGR